MPWKETDAMEERLKFVLAMELGEVAVAELCRRYGVSRKTGYKWWHRYRASGISGLAPLSRAPRHHPQAVSAAVREAVLALRHKEPSWGPKKVRAYLERHRPEVRWPARSTIGELFRRQGLVVARRRRLRAPPRSLPFGTCDTANDVWCIDFKGWFRCGDGSRCEPLTLLDASSRYLLRCQALARNDGSHVWPLLEAAFREYGLPLALRSDNGPPFASVAAGGLSPLAVKLVKAGVMPERIDPGQPQQNGRQERFHLTLSQETARPPARSLRAQAARFEDFRRHYNETRPHEALGQTPPAEHYHASPRAYSGRLREPAYGDDWEVRRVRRNGEIKWRGVNVYLSESLRGEQVGLEEVEDGTRHLYFGPVLLGRLDSAARFHRPKRRRRALKATRLGS